MDKKIKLAFNLEMNEVHKAYTVGDLGQAFSHLERAHILGQRYFLKHWLSHWWMLKIGLRQHNQREIIGQCLRLMAVIPGYIFGWVPKGNTGGANVSPLQPMSLPDDLEILLQDYHVKRDVLIRMSATLFVGILLYTFY